MNTLLEGTLFGISTQRWLIAAGLAAAVIALLFFVVRTLLPRFRKWAESTPSAVDNAVVETVGGTRAWFIVAAGLWIGALSLDLPESTRDAVTMAGTLILLLQVALWGHRLIEYASTRFRSSHIEEDPESLGKLGVAAFLGRLLLWSILLLLALDNFGVDVTALVAGLGVGGIAVALALQTVLSDLFASLSIVMDEPFVVGDFLVLGSEMGTVERIGIKTTRIRSLQGEEIVVSNSDLLGSRIRNFKSMDERRLVETIGVTYGTSPSKLRRVLEIIREAVEAQPDARLDRVHLSSFEDSAIGFEYVYYVRGGDYAVYMDNQEGINLHIIEAFDEEGIEFAYPTRQLYLNHGEDGPRLFGGVRTDREVSRAAAH